MFETLDIIPLDSIPDRLYILSDKIPQILFRVPEQWIKKNQQKPDPCPFLTQIETEDTTVIHEKAQKSQTLPFAICLWT